MGLFIGDNENLTAFSGNQPLPLFPPPPATSNIRWPWWQFGVRIKVISCMFVFFIFFLSISHPQSSSISEVISAPSRASWHLYLGKEAFFVEMEQGLHQES